MDELEAVVMLSQLPGFGPGVVRRLIGHFGSPLAVAMASPKEWACCSFLQDKQLESWEREKTEGGWRRELDLARQLGATIIPYTSPHYPKRLLEIDDYPLVLYLQGEMTKSDSRSVAVVGTRAASIYGLEMARVLSRQLAERGVTVISGLARGIDTAAHQGALEAGRTLAVIGSGLGRLYPTENVALAKRIEKSGAVLSELSLMTAPAKHTFPRRNRIVSAMALATVVVEAPLKSGAMLTAESALRQGRPLFALPGRADISAFAGNHALIKSGKAKLIDSAEDILAHLGEETTRPSLTKAAFLPPLDEEEREVLRQMPEQETSIDALAFKMGWPVAKISGLLMRLMLKKVIREYPGKIYKRV